MGVPQMRGAWIALAMMVACGSWAQTPKGSGADHKSSPKESQIANKAQAAQYPTKNSPLPVSVLPSPEDAAHAASREAAAEQFNSNYLDRQIRLAKASEKQATAAIAAAVIVSIDTLIAGFALWFLTKTYGETKRTADAAVDSAGAAIDAVNISRASIKTDRAWVTPYDVVLQRHEGLFLFTIRWVNSGRTPAIHVRIGAT